MRHIKPYTSQTTATLTYSDLMVNESNLLASVESMIPGDILDQLELNLLVTEGLKKVDEYHRNLINGTNTLINECKSLSSDLKNKLNEAYEELSGKLHSLRINEQDMGAITAQDAAAATIKQGEWDDVMKNIESTSDLSGVGEGSGGLLGMLKGLFSALTEGGSPIGILHFILDIVGLVGDAFGIGLIADLLNGVIYMIRGKWLLAIISFVAAMIPFAGNIIKGWFQTSKVGKEAMYITTEMIQTGAKSEDVLKAGKVVDTSNVWSATAKVSPEAVDMLAKAKPETVEALEYLSKHSKTAVSKAGNILSKFFTGFIAKVVGWVPFIGAPLRKFFTSIGDSMAGFAKSAESFSEALPKVVKEAHVKQMDEFFKGINTPGAKISTDAGNLVVSWRGGYKALPPALLKNYDVVLKRYGGPLAKNAEEVFGKNIESLYKGLAEGIATQSKGYGVVNKIISKGGGMVVNSIVFKKKMSLFIGKMVIKFVQSFGDMLNPLTEGEVELIGNSALQNTMQNRINRELEKDPNLSYSVPYIDQFKDNEAVGVMNNTLNDYASKFGLPDIGMVAYYTNREKDKAPKEVQEFMDTMYDDKLDQIKELESGGVLGGKGAEDLYKTNESKNGMKYITPFSRFI